MKINRRRDLLESIFSNLEHALGPANWWPAETPFEVCIGAILTQNAPWSGVEKSIEDLKEKGIFDVDSLASEPLDKIAACIRPSIYYNQKARKVQSFCRFLSDEFDGKVEGLSRFSLEQARGILLSISGIGFETADSILLYAAGFPVFVVDAYTKRIFARHGLVDEGCGYEELRGYFEDVLEKDAGMYGEFHGLLCMLGAKFCRKKPSCGICPLHDLLGDPLF